jgi:hypothetical protein
MRHEATIGKEQAGITHLWVEGTTWAESERSLADAGWSPWAIMQWTTERQTNSREMLARLPGSWIEDANHCRGFLLRWQKLQRSVIALGV